MNTIDLSMSFVKSERTAQLAYGWGIITKVDGKEYFDHHGDHIPDDAMHDAVTEYMRGKRVFSIQHEQVEKGVLRKVAVPFGTMVHSFPLTEQLAKAFRIVTNQFGWMIGARPDDAGQLAKFESGELTGFSIGGKREIDQYVNDDGSLGPIVDLRKRERPDPGEVVKRLHAAGFVARADGFRVYVSKSSHGHDEQIGVVNMQGDGSVIYKGFGGDLLRVQSLVSET